MVLRRPASGRTSFSKKGLARKQQQRCYRDPDSLPNASQMLERLVPDYQQISGSRSIAEHMALERNKSHSFMVFLQALTKLVGDSGC
jgi:hypothetical protein